MNAPDKSMESEHTRESPKAGIPPIPPINPWDKFWFKILNRPLLFFITTMIIIFLAEFSVMFVISDPNVHTLKQALKDSSLLVLLLFPALYFMVVKPLILQIALRERAECSLKEHYANLEHIVEMRTASLMKAKHDLEVEMNISREAFKELHESQERFRGMVETTSDLIWEVNEKVQYTYVSPKVREILGYEPGELIGKTPFDLMPDDAAKRVSKVFSPIAASKTPFKELENVNYHKNGKRVVLETSGVPLLGSDGALMGYRGIDRDITVRKNIEKERESLTRELQFLVDTTSHDLRNPLVNIQGYSEELVSDMKELLSVLDAADLKPDVRERLNNISKSVPEALKYIQSSVTRIDRLLNGLLDISRSGRVKMEMEILDMDSLVSEVLAIYEYLIRETKVKVSVSSLPRCVGDHDLLSRVFSNLLGNALKFLDIDRPGLISISGRRENDYSVYHIEDNGIGISPEDQEKIYIPFLKVAGSEKSGEGLGLTIVRKILERHDGKVSVQSEPGTGSTFTVSLPGPAVI